MSPLTSRRVVWRELTVCVSWLAVLLCSQPGLAQETVPSEARGAMSLT